jgi:hypothetical protein
MAAFITRTMDQSLSRGNRRAALNQWWTPQGLSDGMLTDISGSVFDVVADGIDLWTMSGSSETVNRVRASDGVRLNPFDLSDIARAGVVASGRIYVAGGGTLSYIQQGHVVTVSSSFSRNLTCITYDGMYVWTGTDTGIIGKTSIVDNSVTTVTSGLEGFGAMTGMLFDGSNVSVTFRSNGGNGSIFRLNSDGTIANTQTTGPGAGRPVFDGTNIWVPNQVNNTVTVIRGATGAVLAQLSGNGLNGPFAAAFDGQRILVVNASSVSLWKSADLSPLGSVNLPSFSPAGVCSDGVNFWLVGDIADESGLHHAALVRF